MATGALDALLTGCADAMIEVASADAASSDCGASTIARALDKVFAAAVQPYRARSCLALHISSRVTAPLLLVSICLLQWLSRATLPEPLQPILTVRVAPALCRGQPSIARRIGKPDKAVRRCAACVQVWTASGAAQSAAPYPAHVCILVLYILPALHQQCPRFHKQQVLWVNISMECARVAIAVLSSAGARRCNEGHRIHVSAD